MRWPAPQPPVHRANHVGGLTTQDGKRVFPNADVYVAKAESDFWLSPEIAAKAPKDAKPFFQSAQAIAAPYVKAGRWHTFSSSERCGKADQRHQESGGETHP